jgi:hypothetical protein
MGSMDDLGLVGIRLRRYKISSDLVRIYLPGLDFPSDDSFDLGYPIGFVCRVA